MLQAFVLPINIAEHIPHAGDMCLLDELVSWDAQSLQARTRSQQKTSNPLRHAQRLGIACGVEYAAQAMALHGSLLAQHTAQTTRPRAGFLASMRDVKLHTKHFQDVECVTISIERQSGDSNTVMYGFSIQHEARILLSGRATVILDSAHANT